MTGFLLGALFVDKGEFVFIDEVDFATEEWFDAVLFGLFEKTGQAIEDTVVGNREGFHAEFGGAGAEFICAGASVEQAVVRMDVEVDEFRIFGQHLGLACLSGECCKSLF